MEKIISSKEFESFIRFANIWANDSESQNESFLCFLRDEAVAGIENCTDTETGHLNIEEAKQFLESIEDATFVFEMMQAEGASQGDEE